MNQNPYYEAPKPVRFSSTELTHLGVAVAALTVAFSFVIGQDYDTIGKFQVPMPMVWLASFLAVGSGFILHEMAHKLMAQYYGHWAEFRAQFSGLGLTIVVAVLAKFLFAAPGAVMIHGRVTPKENGIISLVGPGTNFVIALIAFPFTFTPNELGAQFIIANTIAFVNALLAVFNLLPFGPLDGRKVWYWNRPIYGVAMLLGIGLFVVVLTRPWQL